MLPFLLRPFAPKTPEQRQGFAHWLKTSDGKHLLANQKEALAELLPSITGCRAIQIGVGTHVNLLERCNLPFSWRFSSTQSSATDVIMAPAALPIASQCIDLVVLHHNLDFDDDPYRILNEVTRVLNPGGTLIIVGFNPFSLLGLQRLISHRAHPPLSGRFLRIGRVSDWAGVCGCQTLGYASGYHKPLDSGLGARLNQFMWKRMGSFYVLMTRKQAVPLHPLKTAAQNLLSDMPTNVVAVPAARWQNTKEPS